MSPYRVNLSFTKTVCFNGLTCQFKITWLSLALHLLSNGENIFIVGERDGIRTYTIMIKRRDALPIKLPAQGHVLNFHATYPRSFADVCS